MKSTSFAAIVLLASAGVWACRQFVLALALGAAACTPRTAAPESPVRASTGGSPASAPSVAPVGGARGSGSPGGASNAAAAYEFGPAPASQEPRAVTVSGGLPTEIIKRIVRQANPDFRACYERRTSLWAAGVVAARFTIVADGTVASVNDDGSDFPDEAVVKCVLHVFERLSFPQPEAGTVTVAYPIELPARAH